MHRNRHGRWIVALLTLVFATAAYAQRRDPRIVDITKREAAAKQYFGNDAPWYLENIPFLDIDDPDILRTYFYRWQLYRSHIRQIGSEGTDETEFLPSVPWARHPYEDLNDSSSFHILEGRWLRNPAYVASLVDHLYAGGGNDRHFSESIAAATLAFTQVTGDPRPALRHLDAMQHIYNLWDDHFDASRNLYWIEPLLDATEYTVSSIDASGAGFTDHPSTRDNGFRGGDAFRPSINAFQYGNALAIAQLATLAGQKEVAATYTQRAERLRAATLAQLWNPELQHFTDIYQRSTATVTAGKFIRGRELVGFVPWQFQLPPQHPAAGQPDYNIAWRHALSPSELGGPHGLRTAEPTYPRYLAQYRFDAATGQPECQWNGPSWPFQTSQTLSGLANLLHSYPHDGITSADYLHLLRQYTLQHQLAPGRLDLQEDYNPDTGKPIVGLPRSHHYNHSTYNDLVLSGLIGIRPRSDDVFEIDPLLPQADSMALAKVTTLPGSGETPIRFFALEGLRYHGHDLTVIYDADGTRYHLGAGLQIFSDGKHLVGPVPLGHLQVPLQTRSQPEKKMAVNLAVNVWAREPSPFEPDLPIATSSSTAAGADAYQAIDGREWFFPEIPHGWSPASANDAPQQAWYTVDLRRLQTVAEVQLAFFADADHFTTPPGLALQALVGKTWMTLPLSSSGDPVPNGETHLHFAPVHTSALRLQFRLPQDGRNIRLISFGAFAPAPPTLRRGNQRRRPLLKGTQEE